MRGDTKIFFFSFALFVMAQSLWASAHPQDEGLGVMLARVYACAQRSCVSITKGEMGGSVDEIYADARESHPEKNHLRSDSHDAFQRSLAQEISAHPGLKSLHLEAMVDEKIFRNALIQQLYGTKGRLTLCELGLDVEVFANLVQDEAFMCALKKCATLSRLHVYNIVTSLNEAQVILLLRAFESLPQVRHLGLFDMSKEIAHGVEMRFTLPMVRGLSARGYESLTLDTLRIEGCEEAFAAFFLGRTRPQSLKIKGNTYCHLSGYSALVQAIYAPHGVNLESTGLFFVYVEALKRYTQVLK